MSSILTLTWVQMKNDYSIYSERFKKEVALAHREFFLKRGMDPDNLPRLWDLGDRISRSSSRKNVRPKEQSLPKSFHLSDILKQKNV